MRAKYSIYKYPICISTKNFFQLFAKDAYLFEDKICSKSDLIKYIGIQFSFKSIVASIMCQHCCPIFSLYVLNRH